MVWNVSEKNYHIKHESLDCHCFQCLGPQWNGRKVTNESLIKTR